MSQNFDEVEEVEEVLKDKESGRTRLFESGFEFNCLLQRKRNDL